jgi:hypothetical protein
LNGAEHWGLDEAWKETDKIYEKLYKDVLGQPTRTANGMTEMELGKVM